MPLIRVGAELRVECDYCYLTASYADIDHRHKTIEYLCEAHKRNKEKGKLEGVERNE